MKQFLQSRKGKFIVIIAVAILLIFLQRLHVLRPVENVIITVLKPAQEFLVQVAVRFKGGATYFQDNKELQMYIEDLEEEIGRLTVENIRLERSIQDSEELKQQLAFINETGYQTVSSKVIGRSSDEYLQVLLINKGRKSGVQKGFPVITGNGILVGKIYESLDSISRVLLLGDRHSMISSIIQNEDKSPGIISGEFGISLKMELIPESDTLNKGQLITTSGSEENIPADLIIGTISEIERKEGELFQSAVITPSVKYEDLSVLSVILPYND